MDRTSNDDSKDNEHRGKRRREILRGSGNVTTRWDAEEGEEGEGEGRTIKALGRREAASTDIGREGHHRKMDGAHKEKEKEVLPHMSPRAKNHATGRALG